MKIPASTTVQAPLQHFWHRTRFWTICDYTACRGFIGRILDRTAFRPLMVWSAQWSFDRLRLWIDRGIAPELSRNLWLARITARILLGLVWLLEGLLPKILHVSPPEIALVQKSGVFAGSPEATLFALGLAQIAAGLLLLAGWRERTAATLVTLAMGVFTLLVCWNDPAAFADPYGGIVKNLGLLGLAIVIHFLEPLTPKASRAAFAGKAKATRTTVANLNSPTYAMNPAQTAKPIPFPRRVILAAASFIATILYVLSCAHLLHRETFLAIGLAAAGAWMLFGALLVMVHGRAATRASADCCLRTMLPGNVVLLAGALLNFAGLAPMSERFQAVVLLAANTVMFAEFRRQARALPLRGSPLTWWLVLNACFALLLTFLPRNPL